MLSAAVIGLAAAVAGRGAAQDGGGAETSVPVRRVGLPGGGRYFALPLRVGSTELTAAIDTGSPGLRVLAPRLADGDYRVTGDPASMAFGSGTVIDGDRAVATVAFGARSGPARIEVIRRVGCTRDRPGCAEGRLPLGQLGMMGGAKPGQGAPAIIGLSRSDTPVTVPFPELGVRRWILDVPNDVATGRLVLDPADASRQGFVAFPAPAGPDGKPMGAIRGCLRNEDSGVQVCGLIAFDTGAAGISVSSPGPLPRGWPPGAHATLLYQDEGGRTRLVQRFRTGDPAHSTRLRFDDAPHGRATVIHANASPYLCFDVMYEAGMGPISLRPRRSGPNDPQAAYAP